MPTTDTHPDTQPDTQPRPDLPAADSTAVGTYASVLADYFRINEIGNEAAREKRKLRPLVDVIPNGAHGHYIKSVGESGEVMDQDEVKEVFATLARLADEFQKALLETGQPLNRDRVREMFATVAELTATVPTKESAGALTVSYIGQR